MIRSSCEVMRIRGVPVRIHWTFGALFVLLVGLTARRGGFAAALEDAILVLALVACVVLHEIGHTVAARRRGIAVREINLYPFGGVTVFSEPFSPGRTEVLIALAGPAVNLSIGVLLFAVTGGRVAIPGLPGEPAFSLSRTLFWANILLGLLNLMPVLPLDGGRILRSLLAGRIGEARASRLVANLGQVLGVIILVWGVTTSPWLFLLGAVLFLGATGELRRLQPLILLRTQTIDELMNEDVIEVPATEDLAALQARSSAEPYPDFVVVGGARVIGVIPAPRVLKLSPTDETTASSAGGLAAPMGPPLLSGTSLWEAMLSVRSSDAEYAPVHDADGKLVGVLNLRSLERSVTLLEALARRKKADDAG